MGRPREELDALAAECARFTTFLQSLRDEDWIRPTRCTGWDVRDVLVHMTTMMQGVERTATEPFLDDDPKKDRLSWWDYDIEQDKAEGAEWVAEAGTRFPAGSMLSAWEATVAGAIPAALRALSSGDPVAKPGEQPIKLSEYLATRVLEMTIHGMDVRDALGLEPDPSKEGIAVTHGILAGRLGADPGESGFDEVDFANAATGRRSLSEEESERLGDLAKLLPLLA
jgi:uncharacterized protein (TIGR03083 family)